MKIESENCVICAEECLVSELKSIALSTFNVTKFKICQNCLNSTDPQDDYASVRAIIASYVISDKKL